MVLFLSQCNMLINVRCEMTVSIKTVLHLTMSSQIKYYAIKCVVVNFESKK